MAVNENTPVGSPVQNGIREIPAVFSGGSMCHYVSIHSDMTRVNRMVKFAHLALLMLLVAACSKEAAPPVEPRAPERAMIEPPKDRVEAGGETLRGELLNPETGLTVFRGIPFAAPPTGANRWRPPLPHAARQGVRDATRFGPACPQLQGNPEFYRYVAERLGQAPDTVPAMHDISEDCLYLNVWTRYAGQRAQRPVMVWIYGGGNTNGYSHEPEYLGDRMAERGVVYVSLNYRLGALGYLAHPGLSAESANGVSGNYGILDQIAALQWVRENIAAFGGDPNRVTIFGESAGAANAATLIASPPAQGLFHRAISQSGGYPVDVFQDLSQAEEIGAKIAGHLGVEDPEEPARTVARLRELPWMDLVQGAVDAGVEGYANVNVDGWVLPEALAAVFENGVDPGIELIIGSNRNENYPWVKEEATFEDLERRLQSFESPDREDLRALLSAAPGMPPRLLMDRLDSADWFLCPSLFIASRMARNGNPVYFYYFTRVRPGGERLLAYHGAEISYALDTAYPWLPADETDRRLTETMGQYWVNFAASGSPDGPGLPEWPVFTGSAGEYLELGDVVQPGEGLETGLCAILDRRRTRRM
jgi:para-nitrobenzyl esterase